MRYLRLSKKNYIYEMDLRKLYSSYLQIWMLVVILNDHSTRTNNMLKDRNE